MEISMKERETLRDLAKKYMEYALSDQNIQNRELWRALNMHNMQKPMVSIEQMPWHELNTDGFLTCTVRDGRFRGIESMLRMQIYKWEHMPADMVLNPYISVSRAISNTGFGIGIIIRLIIGNSGFLHRIIDFAIFVNILFQKKKDAAKRNVIKLK